MTDPAAPAQLPRAGAAAYPEEVPTVGPEFDDSRTAYVRGGVIATRYRGVLYAFSDVMCATTLHPPAAPQGATSEAGSQPGPGHACRHPLLSHARPERPDGLWGRCGRCACQGHDPGFPTEPVVFCRWCSRETSLPEAVERTNRRGGKFWLCRPCDASPPG